MYDYESMLEKHIIVCFIDIYIKFDTLINFQFSTKLYAKRDDFEFAIVNFPHIDSSLYSDFLASPFCNKL